MPQPWQIRRSATVNGELPQSRCLTDLGTVHLWTDLRAPSVLHRQARKAGLIGSNSTGDPMAKTQPAWVGGLPCTGCINGCGQGPSGHFSGERPFHVGRLIQPRNGIRAGPSPGRARGPGGGRQRPTTRARSHVSSTLEGNPMQATLTGSQFPL
ncbi:hypothetical protein BSAF29S_05019 [Bacillus safensis subsp. safensis]